MMILGNEFSPMAGHTVASLASMNSFVGSPPRSKQRARSQLPVTENHFNTYPSVRTSTGEPADTRSASWSEPGIANRCVLASRPKRLRTFAVGVPGIRP